MSDNEVAAARVLAVLLADGWHRLVRGSFRVGPLSFGAEAGPGTPGFRFEEADAGRPYQLDLRAYHQGARPARGARRHPPGANRRRNRRLNSFAPQAATAPSRSGPSSTSSPLPTPCPTISGKPSTKSTADQVRTKLSQVRQTHRAHHLPLRRRRSQPQFTTLPGPWPASRCTSSPVTAASRLDSPAVAEEALTDGTGASGAGQGSR